MDAEDSYSNILAYLGTLNTCSGPDGFTDYFNYSSRPLLPACPDRLPSRRRGLHSD